MAALAIVGGCGSGSGAGGSTASGPGTGAGGSAASRPGTAAAAGSVSPGGIPVGPGALAVMAGRAGFTIRARPHGEVAAHLDQHTPWGSPTVVWAVRQRGSWLGVIATTLPNNRVGWIDTSRSHPRMWRNEFSLDADLSQRTLELRRRGTVVDRMRVGIGSPSTPTPTGRFTVTDKLIPGRQLSYYGCCIIALSGHQPNLRPGWAGGDRIAIHGGVVGGAASAGCLHADPANLRKLMRLVPVGTPVTIRS